jgi:hypothetical protein
VAAAEVVHVELVGQWDALLADVNLLADDHGVEKGARNDGRGGLVDGADSRVVAAEIVVGRSLECKERGRRSGWGVVSCHLVGVDETMDQMNGSWVMRVAQLPENRDCASCNDCSLGLEVRCRH